MNILPKNEHRYERLIRITVGLGLLSLTQFGPATIWGYLGIVPLMTGALGSCPAYTIFGVSTCGLSEKK